MPKPSICRSVHFANPELAPVEASCLAAIITEVNDEDTISATVFSPEGIFFCQELPYDEDKAGGTWHWPEREDDAPTTVPPAKNQQQSELT